MAYLYDDELPINCIQSAKSEIGATTQPVTYIGPVRPHFVASRVAQTSFIRMR